MPRILSIAVLLCALNCDHAQAVAKQQKKLDVWSGEVRGTLWLRNLNGAITVEPAQGSKVEVRAEVRWRKSNPDGVELVRREGPGGTTFCVLYPAKTRHCGEGGAYRHQGTTRNDLEVQIRVRVPAGLKLDVSAVNGSVSIDADSETLLVDSQNGSIRARASGPTTLTGQNGSIRVTGVASKLSVETTNGAINVDLAGPSPRGPIRLSTINGAIRLSAATLNASVEASTVNGQIRVAGKRYRRRASVELGKGGTTLAANTVNGSIQIAD